MEKIFNKKTKKKIAKTKRGFSLVEVLFSLLILSIGIGAVMSLMTISIKTSNTAKNQVIASELAQEGIELVKNLKDNAATSTTFTTEVANGENYRIDYLSTFANFKSSGIADNKRLNLDPTSKVYLHAASGTPTKFFRKISVFIMAPIAPDTKKTAVVTSFVSWNGVNIPADCNIANKCVSVVSMLLDM